MSEITKEKLDRISKQREKGFKDAFQRIKEKVNPVPSDTADKCQTCGQSIKK